MIPKPKALYPKPETLNPNPGPQAVNREYCKPVVQNFNDGECVFVFDLGAHPNLIVHKVLIRWFI